MKKIFFGILAMAAFAACSNEEQIAAPKGEAIAFGNAFVDNSVRAGEAADPSYGTHNSLTSFNVYGAVDGSDDPVAIFEGEEVTGTVGQNSVWDCSAKTQYWINGAVYNFAAVVNGNVTEKYAVADGADAHLPKTINFDTPDAANVDLLYARSLQYVGQPIGSNVKVEFDFAHLLSKIKFSVLNNSKTATGYSFLVKNISIAATDEANYDVETSTWAEVTAGDFLLANVELTNTTDATVESAAEKLIVPGNVAISFTVDIICGGETITTTDYGPYDVSVEAGKAYNLKTQVSVGDPIQFTVSENPTWANGNTADSDDDDTVNDYVPVN